jgi:hypothetical protein
MPWFKVDDKLHDHRKARKAGATAMGVWVLAGSWAADGLTDGFVPADVLPRWGRPRDAARLVDAGLWYPDEQDGEKGWRFHEWDERQPSRAETLEKRATKAEAGRLGGIASGKVRKQAKAKHGASPVVEAHANSRTRPEPDPSATYVADLSGDDFDHFWAIYPKRVGKGHAKKAWPKAVEKAGATTIIAAAKDYASWCESENKDPQYIKNPSTWLNGECWDDERPARREPESNIDKHLALVRELEENEQRQIGST